MQNCLRCTTTGSRQLFLGDVQTGVRKYAPLFDFLAHQVVLSPNREPLDALPEAARSGLLAVVAAYMPYYAELGVSEQWEAMSEQWGAMSDRV